MSYQIWSAFSKSLEVENVSDFLWLIPTAAAAAAAVTTAEGLWCLFRCLWWIVQGSCGATASSGTDSFWAASAGRWRMLRWRCRPGSATGGEVTEPSSNRATKSPSDDAAWKQLWWRRIYGDTNLQSSLVPAYYMHSTFFKVVKTWLAWSCGNHQETLKIPLALLAEDVFCVLRIIYLCDNKC